MFDDRFDPRDRDDDPRDGHDIYDPRWLDDPRDRDPDGRDLVRAHNRAGEVPTSTAIATASRPTCKLLVAFMSRSCYWRARPAISQKFQCIASAQGHASVPS